MHTLPLPIQPQTPLLLRRAEKIPSPKNLPVTANMTVVTTPSREPEMRDQTQDQTAPRND